MNVNFSYDRLPESVVLSFNVDGVFLNTPPGDSYRLWGKAHNCVHSPYDVARTSIVTHQGEVLVLGGLPRVGDKTESGRLRCCDKCGYSLLHLSRVVLIGRVTFAEGVDNNQVGLQGAEFVGQDSEVGGVEDIEGPGFQLFPVCDVEGGYKCATVL